MSVIAGPVLAPDREDGDRAGARRLPRWVWPVLVVVGSVVLIGAALLRHGGAVQADRTEAVPVPEPLPGLASGASVEQRFTAGADGLAIVNVRVGTFGREPTCTLRTTLTSDAGEELAASVVPCPELRDAQLTPIIRRSPVPGSEGQRYRLRFEVSGGGPPITLFGTEPTPTRPIAQRSDGEPEELAVELHTDYGDDAFAAAQVGTALDRIGQYGAPWRAPVSVVLLVVGSVLLLAGLTLAPWRWALVLLVAFAVTKGVFWSVVVPPMLGVDEISHIAYVQTLAVDHRIPERGRPQGDSPRTISVEAETAAMVFRQPFVARSDRSDFGPGRTGPGHEALAAAKSEQSANGDSTAAGYSPTYYLVPAAIHAITPGTIDVRIGAMRLWSVALGAATVLCAALLGRRLFPDVTSAALLLGVAVALQPMLSQQTAIINNDALVIAMGAVCTLVAVALASPVRSRWWALGAGLAFGVGLLAKPFGVVFAPVLLVAWLIGRGRGAREVRWWWEAGLAALGVIVTYGTWFVVANVFGYAGVGIESQEHTGPTGLADFVHLVSADGWALVRKVWIEQFWGDFSWSTVHFPGWVHAVVLGAVLVGAAVVVTWLVVAIRDALAWRRGGGPWRTEDGATLASGTVVCFLVAAGMVAELTVLMFLYFRRTGDLDLVQGRYALLAVPAVLALPAAALRRLVPRLSPVVPLAVIAVSMAVLNVAGLGLVVERFYL